MSATAPYDDVNEKALSPVPSTAKGHSEAASETALAELEETERLAKRARRKFDFIVVPIVTLFYLMSFLDRTNIGNARTAGLQADLGMSDHQFSIALTISYVPFILAELPSNLILKHFQPNRLLPIYVTLWGIVATLQGLVTNYHGLLAVRFFLGLTEGGLVPGALLYITSFYERHHLQVRIAIFFTATSLAGAFSGLLAYGISHMDGVGGKPGWAWIFILEGILTVIIGVSFGWALPQSPGQAYFLTDAERDATMFVLRRDLNAEEDEEPLVWKDVLTTWLQPHFLVLIPVNYAAGIMLTGLSIFIPSIIKTMGYSAVRSQLLSVPPYAVAFVISLTLALFSDRYRARGPTCILAGLLAASGFAIFYAHHDKHVRYGSLFLSVTGSYISAPASTAWVNNLFAPHYRRASVIAFSYLLVYSGGITSTWIFTHPPQYRTATIINLTMSLLFSFFSGVTLVYLYFANQRKVREKAAYEASGQPPISAAEKKRLGDRHYDFKYSY